MQRAEMDLYVQRAIRDVGGEFLHRPASGIMRTMLAKRIHERLKEILPEEVQAPVLSVHVENGRAVVEFDRWPESKER